MSFVIKIEKRFLARQGLPSPVRVAKRLPPLDQGFATVLRVGIAFADDQLGPQGWFVDTDAIEAIVEGQAQYLAGDTWTKLFSFRPTYELVARATYETLAPQIPQLSFIELDNQTMGVITHYQA